MRTMTTTRSNQSVILLRGLFRAAISFSLKWPDPIRFHSVLYRALVHASSLRLFSIDGRLVCDRPRDISVRDIANEIIL